MTSPPARRGGGWLRVAVFSVGWIGVLLGVIVAGALLAVGQAMLGGGLGGLAGADPAEVVPPWLNAVYMALQFAGMVSLIPLVEWLARLIEWRQGPPERSSTAWVDLLAWRPPTSAVMWVPVVGVGLTAGWLPGQVAEWMRAALPWLDLGALANIEAMLTGGSLPMRVVLAVLVVAGAAIAEELVFRGWMWTALERSASTPVVWVLTSLLFAVYHIDPIQGSALVFTALALGWVRWMTGSLWACVAVHAINNALGVLSAYLPGLSMPPWLAVVGALVTVGAGAWLWRLRTAS